MIGKRLLTKPTLGVVVETGRALVIPSGDFVEIPNAQAAGRRTVDVVWGGKDVMMFVNDLLTRSRDVTPVEERDESPRR